MARHFIYIGSPTSPGYHDLGQVKPDLLKLRSYFESEEQQYEWVLKEIAIGASASIVRNEIEKWFASPERKCTDEVILYIAGHGEYEIGSFREHKIAMVDSDPNLPSSYLKTDGLVDIIFDGKNERPRNVLLILDVCYAGKSGALGIAHYQRAGNSNLEGQSGFYIVSAAGSEFEAVDGSFATGMLEVLSGDSWRRTGKYISVVDMVSGVNDWFGSQRTGQQAIVSLAGAATSSTFFRNKSGIVDFSHWDLKARGVSIAGDKHWFFCGRRKVLRELCHWLTTSLGDGKVRFIVGDPGSGKSAILSHLYLSSLTASRQELINGLKLTENDDTVAVLGSVKVAINVRGLDVISLIKLLSASLGREVDTLYDLGKVLNSISSITGVLIDSLDEAMEVRAIENELLPVLSNCKYIRLIVATRRTNCIKVIPSRVIDIDDDEYFSEEEVKCYICRKIAVEFNKKSLLIDEPKVAAITQGIAKKAGHSFLYARVVALSVARTLLLDSETTELLYPTDELPATLNEAFENELDRLPLEKKHKLIDLLLPLAYSKGKGLPVKNIWRSVASHIAGKEYSNNDVREVRELFNYYLVEDADNGNIVYRLFHQAFADFLRQKTKDEDVETRFAQALLSIRPYDIDGSQTWKNTKEPYLIKYFAAHAADANVLSKHLLHHDFLLSYPSIFVLPHLHKVTSAHEQKLLKAYRHASSFSNDENVFPVQLLLKAQKYGVQELSNTLNELSICSAWKPSWSKWRKSSSSYLIANGQSEMVAFTLYEDNVYGPIAVCAYNDCSVIVWDIQANTILEEYNLQPVIVEKGFGYVKALNAIRHDGILTIAARSSQGFLALISQREAILLNEYDSNTRCQKALLVNDCSQLKLFVVAETRGRENILFDSFLLPNISKIKRVNNAFQTSVYTLETAVYNDTSVLIIGCDTIIDGQEKDCSPLQLRNLQNFDLIWELSKDLISIVEDALTFRWMNHLWILADCFGKVKLIKPATSQIVDILGISWGHLMGFHISSQKLELLCTSYNCVHVFSLIHANHGIEIVSRFTGSSLSAYGGWKQTRLYGRTAILRINEKALRVWDFQELLDDDVTNAIDAFDLHDDDDQMGGVILGNYFVAYTSTGKIYTWGTDGLLKSTSKCGKKIQCAAGFIKEDKPFLMIACEDNCLRILDIAIGEEPVDVIVPENVSNITDLQVIDIGGKHTIIATVNKNKAGKEAYYIVRRWDLHSRAEIFLPQKRGGLLENEFRMMGYYVSKSLAFVRYLKHLENEYYIFGAPNGELRAMDSLGKEKDCWNDRSPHVYGSACAVFSDTSGALVVSGNQSGTLTLRNISHQRFVCEDVRGGHVGRVNCIITQRVDSHIVIITAGKDGRIHFWSSKLIHYYTINLENEIYTIDIENQRLFAVCIEGVVCIQVDWSLVLK